VWKNFPSLYCPVCHVCGYRALTLRRCLSPPHTHCVVVCVERLSSTLCVCVCLGVSVSVCVVCVCVTHIHSFSFIHSLHSFPLTHFHSHLSNHIFIIPLIVSLLFTYFCCVVCVFGGCMGEECVDCHSLSLIHPPSLCLTSQPTPTPWHTLYVCMCVCACTLPLTFDHLPLTFGSKAVSFESKAVSFDTLPHTTCVVYVIFLSTCVCHCLCVRCASHLTLSLPLSLSLSCL
jgi:hypothetical protein